MTEIATPNPNSCCAEYTRLSRRGLLGGSVALAGLSTVVGSAVVSASPAQAASAGSVLVVVSMRGASDGLSLVVPHADPIYYEARPRIAIPSDRLLAKDAMFGLHPQMAPLLPMWNAGRVGVVHAAGLPAPNRSHFAAMEEIEDANPGSVVRQGWLNRLLGERPGTSSLQGFSLGSSLSTAMYGPEQVMSASDVDDVEFPGQDRFDTNDGRRRSLHTLWDNNTSPLGRSMAATFDAVENFTPAREQPSRAADYPRSDLGNALSEAARIVRGNVGVEVITVDQGDWDMHSGLGTTEWGAMKVNAADFAGSIAAFFNDLGDQASKVTLVAFSEFGRRVRENSNFGLDHGHGNAMFLAGAGVRGGYHGNWPGLTNELDSDLLVTTDYRSVLAEVVSRRFNASTAAVFPGFTPESVGAMAAS